MSTLYDLSNNIITDMVNDVLISLDTIKIRNRLLDGTWHIQTIGKPVTNVNITCHADETGKNKIDRCEAISEPIVLKRDDKSYTGLVLNPPTWEQVVKGANGLYKGDFVLVVNGEGIV